MCIIPRQRVRAYILARRRRAVSLVFKFSPRMAAESARVKRSDFYCISQLGTAAGNCAQRNILFYSVFIRPSAVAPSFLLSLFPSLPFLLPVHTACVHTFARLLSYFPRGAFIRASTNNLPVPLLLAGVTQPPLRQSPFFRGPCHRDHRAPRLTRQLKQLYHGGENFLIHYRFDGRAIVHFYARIY